MIKLEDIKYKNEKIDYILNPFLEKNIIISQIDINKLIIFLLSRNEGLHPAKLVFTLDEDHINIRETRGIM